MDEELKFLTVTILTRYIKNIFDKDPFLGQVLVEGEISNFTYNSSGHLYFTLKDENAQISCVMFKAQTQYLNFMPKDGDKVYAKGTVQVYEKSGRYQLYVQALKEKGLGDLYQKYLELKDKLEKKGYFDQETKKPLPMFPKNIALLTSKTGAVIEDLKSIILKRSQFSNITLYPTKVQGKDAKYNIVENIKKANENKDIDVIILARGGGSIEDLWPFNEEIVADAIHNSLKPIISAIGHETDFTISDFTADLRAATPSDAALIVVKDSKDLKDSLNSLNLRLNNAFINFLRTDKNKVDKALSNPIFKDPVKILNFYKQNLINLSLKLDSLSPKAKLEKENESLKSFILQLNNAYKSYLYSKKHEYLIYNEKLSLLNPLAVLNKGYSITYKEDTVIKSEKDLEDGDLIKTILFDGSITSKVIKEAKK